MCSVEVHNMRLKREVYLEQIRPYYDSDIIKVITGVRKSGKSILLETIKDELAERGVHGDHIIYLNLEDMNETILNGKLLTWTDRIFKQINIIEGTKKHNGNKTRFYTGKYFKETGSFYGTDIWRTGFTGNVWSS